MSHMAVASKERFAGRHGSYGAGARGTIALGLVAAAFAVAASVQVALCQDVPTTRRDNVEDVLNGVHIVDPYRWLENQQSPETRAWIDAENGYTESLLDNLPGRDRIKQQITALKRLDSVGTPAERGGRLFFMKRLAAQDQSCICLRAGISGEDEILVDPHLLSPDHTVNVEISDITVDGKLLAYGIRQGGEDETVVRFYDVDKRELLTDELPRADYFSVCLKNDHTGLYYCVYDTTGNRVFYHLMGTDVARDVQIFGRGFGPDRGVSVAISDDDRYLLYNVSLGWSSNDLYMVDLARSGEVVTLVKDAGATFEGHMAGKWLFILTDLDAPRGKVMKAELARPRQEAWSEIVSECADILDGLSVCGDKVFATYTHDAVPSVRIFEADGKPAGTVELPDIGYVSSLSGRWGSIEVFFTFSSFHIPPRVYNYDVEDGTTALWARVEAPIESDKFEIEQAWYQSKDGTRVPMFIGHAKSVELDGSNPTLLTGYGGFRSSATPYYSTDAAIWLLQGGVYAEPCLRGGLEFGEEWHTAGMLDKKQNTFDDFIAAAEWLIKHRYTSPEKLAISGASNGGLLVGAALTQRPDLFRAVVCSYPLLDMLRYQKFMLGPLWVPEYGSADDPDQFKYLYAYSPYQHVAAGVKYPAVLLITGDADTRVAPLHARKMTAMLQAATASGMPVLLHYDTKGGHSGGTPVTKQIDDLTDETLFLDWQLGVKY
jgi:prolyl oligopeptidase